MASIGTLKKKIQRRFKIRGFTLKTESLDEVLAFLARFPDAEDEALDLLIDEIDKETCEIFSQNFPSFHLLHSVSSDLANARNFCSEIVDLGQRGDSSSG